MKLLTTRNLLLGALTLALWQTPLTSRAATPDAGVTFTDPVVATGNGFSIKRSQLDEAFASYSASVAANGGSIPAAQRSELRGQILQHLIVNQMMAQKATPEDRAKVKKFVDDYLGKLRQAASSPAAFDEQIKATGMTIEQVRQQAIDEQLGKVVLERVTTNSIPIPDADAKKFYDDNPTDFDRPEQAHVAHILISTEDASHQPLPPEQKKAKEKLANEVRAKALKGDDFGKLAKEYSDDPGSKDTGGEYTFGRGRMVHAFEVASFSLKTNQISDLVETQYGYHIIKLIEKLPPKHESFADVEGRIKAYLASKQLPAYIKQMEKDEHVNMVAQDDITPAPSP